jgi:hypothetical protein
MPVIKKEKIPDPSLACGECFTWAYDQILKRPNATLVHGQVTHPKFYPHRYSHAWIEIGDEILDWQHAIGFKKRARGPMSRAYFRMVYQPIKTRRFTRAQAIKKARKVGHLGPW